MKPSQPNERHSRIVLPGERNNNFGFLRLLFASLVVVSHAPQLVDGNSSREILTRIFGTLSFGDVAVDGFFLISGYLITKSFVQTRSIRTYLLKRFLRIFPGYAVSFWLCVLVLAPLVGAPSRPSVAILENQFHAMLTLLPPGVPGAFIGLLSPSLNGPMWTIAYEFRCYLAVIVVGALGAFTPRYRPVLAGVVLALLLVNAWGILWGVWSPGIQYLGKLSHNVRLLSVFGVGSLYYLYADAIKLSNRGAVIAAAGLVPLMFFSHCAEMAYALLGGYLIFWFALRTRVLESSLIGNRIDISYGLYLYAWPIQNLVIWHYRHINPWLLCLIALPCAAICGILSWTLIERPFLKLAHWQSRSASTPLASVPPQISRQPT
jgi:peptidoglycan/LPS O-acetylase OafA/YrhL